MPRIRATSDRELLTITEAALRAGIGARRLRAAIRAGDLPAYTTGTSWQRILWPELVAWVRRSRVSPTAHAEQRVAEILEREQRRDGGDPGGPPG